MKTKNFIGILFITTILFLNIKFVYAVQYSGRQVSVTIESFDRTIAKGKVNAFTFKEAIERFAIEENIDVIFSQLGSVSNIYSVNGIKNNKFGEDDGWLGYILRDGVILKEKNFLNKTLQENDEIFIYYGLEDYTQIISSIDVTSLNDMVTIDLRSNYLIDNKATEKKLSNLKVNITNLDNTIKIININAKGMVSTTLSNLGIYKISVKDGKYGKYPNVVKTKDYFYFYGIKNSKSITRAEAVAFIVNQYNVLKGIDKRTFSDVKVTHPFYKQIDIAASNNIITGFDDGTFRPEEKINLMQLCIIIEPLFIDRDSDLVVNEETKLLPEWAKPIINKVINKGVLDGVNIDFYRLVTKDDILQIHENILDKWD